MNYLIVGGSSAAGQSAVRSIRRKHPDAHIIGTTSKEATEQTGIDVVIGGIDLNKESAAGNLAEQVKAEIDILFYTPAFGPIGYPVAESPANDIKTGMAFCYDPMVKLTELLKPRLTIGYSAFYWKPHLLAFYGSLAYVKLSMEKLAVEKPEQYRMIRAGSFPSKATRGISLLLRRQFKKTKSPQLVELAEGWQASGKKFDEYFFDYIYMMEEKAFSGQFEGPYRSTTEEDLEWAADEILNDDPAPIMSAMGGWHWKETQTPDLPADFKEDLL